MWMNMEQVLQTIWVVSTNALMGNELSLILNSVGNRKPVKAVKIWSRPNMF